MIKNKFFSNKFFYKKNFGQNFLKDKQVIKKIINVINPKNNDLIIEIGPGLGSLTIPLCSILKKLTVIEIDRDILNFFLNKKFFHKLNFHLLNVLYFNFLEFYLKNKKKKIRIVGNLPYNISTKLLLNLIKYFKVFKDMYFMFQKEVADRILSFPNTKLYGRLSIIVQYFFKVKKILDVSSNSFFPKPKVNSTFLKFIPRKSFSKLLFDINIFSKITNLAFSQRRKILKHSLKKIFLQDTLIFLKINPKLRAENLSIKQYSILTDYYIKNKFSN
ncbi:MAG: 16S rRNA (adenine(1518)-N(6)/adenine(1519)-N(6))-dimethyltransferase RsmA [Buchnera aphidicola (Periphyllus lyropictus)]|uniref:16S rRNA (adenine(1518)-N(6)/adenine(1519)-N(6))- dimethyltransferase RsmA n=1 Tax=Buchnera aphidicola TaxID=9 RepID=UPI001EB74F3D|nr:16S rRNA (adenine(1518)-N(6)/adenine(1519)-N(6))-dimethyltransferase RsmA [Buchnera aphidicola]NIH16701.1 16S rRNA (adenine(1518)-N(6)/adenine(1519)-N(6))-dimethyltransferase RsmA [Buchnera aphidicola (Periphyllus lyropictus)]USS94608.1 16S rRNA (adenine(1518)-N(6)/adenine(1519)-N(6))-dimethyltransferase RsmA [Buchnera aphidicola (Periphyllus lyropictus)]